MKRIEPIKGKLTLILIVIIVAMAALVSCTPQAKKFQAPLFNNLGDYWVETSTRSNDANMFFVQGLLMSYGFNHAESVRSFKEAIRLDSTYAMAYWGLAYVLGPNYNLGMSKSDKEEVMWSVRQAQKHDTGLSNWEKALIEAIAIKFPENLEAVDEEKYASFMRDLVFKFPKNPDILAFIAEAQMNVHAWDLYMKKGGEAKEWTPLIISLLENALKLDPMHPLANHLYIHATEASKKPSIANESAKKLETLVPGSGHLVHMPSHIYINTGDYHQGSLVNEQAAVVDSTYVAQCKAQGAYPQLYYPHNYHFLAACAALEGRGAKSLEASFIMADIIDRAYLGKPGYGATQHFVTTPYNVLIKFAQWEKILALNSPDIDYPYLTAMWKYSRGMALANTGKSQLALAELNDLDEIRQSRRLEEIGIFDINTAQDVAEIAFRVLSAEIADKQGNYPTAEEFLLSAIDLEDHLNYNEPPDWFFSVRHLLGDLYLRNAAYKKAEKVYMEDLATFPKNGFALNGLYYSLKNQGKSQESEQILKQFVVSWRFADSKLKYSRVDEATRKNLKLSIKANSPSELIYLAGNFCGIN